LTLGSGDHSSVASIQTQTEGIRAMGAATSSVTDKSFQKDVMESDLPVVVDFWAEWCGPCRMIAPHLEAIANELSGKVKIVKLNIDENPEIAGQVGIRSIPTLMIFKGGENINTKVGAGSRSDLQKWIETSI
jgi:thioredoxin 1